MLAFEAVGVDVPWRGVLLAYAAAQLATNLPITPGGLGVVEGSLTVALVAFGGAARPRPWPPCSSTGSSASGLILPVGWGTLGSHHLSTTAGQIAGARPPRAGRTGASRQS